MSDAPDRSLAPMKRTPETNGSLGPSPKAMLAQAHLMAVLKRDARRRLARNEPLVVTIETQSATWTEAVADAASRLFPAAEIIRGSTPGRSGAKPNAPSSPIGAVFAISANLSWLHPAIEAAADLTQKIRLDARITAKTLRKLVGEPIRLAPSDVVGLDLADIGMAIRPNSTAADIIDRLRRAVQSRSGVVSEASNLTLADCVGYGDAHVQISRLARQVIAARDAGGTGPFPGVLLFGEAGTGKTRLAKAFARTVGLPIVETSVGDLFSSSDGFLGGVIAAAAKVFEDASAATPTVLFLDELDSLPDRSSLDGRSRDWWTPLITFFLLAIDRARSAGVLVVAATNYRNRLDAALLRPGRLDLHIHVAPPKKIDDVVAIFRACLAGALADADLTPVARIAGRPTGARIQSFVEAARQCADDEARPLTLSDLVAAVAPPDDRPPEFVLQAARHEAGHAVAGVILGLTLKTVSIIESDDAGGMASFRPTSPTSTRLQLEAAAITALSGRAVDELTGTGATSGAASDMALATRLIAAVHGVFSLGDALVVRADPSAPETSLLSDPTLRATIEADLQRLMTEARQLVERHADAIEAVARRLVAERIIDRDQVAALIVAHPPRETQGAGEVHGQAPASRASDG